MLGVAHIGDVVGALEQLVGGTVVHIVPAEFHAVVEEVAGHIGTCIVAGGDTATAAEGTHHATAATAAAEAAAHHAAHHAAGEVAGSGVVGVVAAEDEADLGLVGESAEEGICGEAGGPGRLVVGGDIVSCTCGHLAEESAHHAGLDGEVDDILFIAVVDAGELGLLGFLLDDLELVDELGGYVLGSHLGVVEEEGLAVHGDTGDSLAVHGDLTACTHLHAGKFLEQILKDIALRSLE